MKPRVILQKIIKNLFVRNQPPVKPNTISSASPPSHPLWLYRPEGATEPIQDLEGVRIVQSWESVLKAIQERFPTQSTVRVRIYPCGSLQCLDTPAGQDQGSGD